MNSKKCLLIRCKDLMMDDCLWGATESGNDCDCLDIPCNTLDLDDSAIQETISHVHKNPTEIVFSMNFSPTISAACKELGVPYAAWIYDCPLQSLYNSEINNETNHIFSFDKYLLKLLRERGVDHSYYLPLAANISKMGRLEVNAADETKYSCDISFVGKQYVDGRFANYKERLSAEFVQALDNAALGMLGKWDGRDRVHNILSEDLLNALVDASEEDPGKKLGVPNRMYFEEVVITRAVAYTERRLMMEAVSDMAPRWYGADAADKDKLPGVSYHEALTYNETLPKAYNLSRINLSSCLHSIYSGIPLRVFDIMGAGGFILSNYQPEIEELFDIGKEIVVYHNFDEMHELARFFLSHESARLAILMAGYEKVCNEFTYPVAVKKMIERVFS